jgi:hypothetical protein
MNQALRVFLDFGKIRTKRQGTSQPVAINTDWMMFVSEDIR